MTRNIGTTARGLRAPIIKEGDNLYEIIEKILDDVVKNDNISLNDMDVLAITESLLARAQGNYVDIDKITKDLNSKYNETIGVVFPITSRNRFSIIMKAIANTEKKIKVFLSYPSDEVGNSLFDKSLLIGKDINIYKDTLSEKEYRDLVGEGATHHFTGVDYVKLYKDFAINDNIEIFLTNNPNDILNYTDEILVANIHERDYLKDLFKRLGAKTVYSLADIMTESIDGSGYNSQYGLYGSNLSTDNSIKLFPRDSQKFVDGFQEILKKKYNKNIQVMIYGDGAFKDPVGKIWELADPVVSPGYTSALEGTPNEIKIKYIADADLKGLNEAEASEAIKDRINKKSDNLVGDKSSLGTTPRQLTDLLGSLSDLISGSGDKGTPIVLIQGYFDNYASN
ncbi:coenzyme F420-0:L-glutamate ligase [Miniphocaeibacter massiliensis]|uniref:coenzyme F420-0:L-glutamate ligase n=1 Tax=Miniphocaeibacter massiliensis TaxID=2041841 RepID=UPI000C1BEDBB|nr:coenzyme F420-0:L-glutamate ligase [Miniphocaeibacter massiliensis]